MQLGEGVRLAAQQIRTQKLKSFFSVLGVVIGVMFLVTVVSIVEGMDQYIRVEVSNEVFGVNTVTLQRRSSAPQTEGALGRAQARNPLMTFEDADAIRSQLSVPARVGVESDGGGEVEGPGGRKVENARIVGISPEIFEIRDYVTVEGRPFTRQEASRGTAVVVLGSETARLLFPDRDPLGETVRIRSYPFRVVGVLEERGSLFGFSLDNLVIAPSRSPVQGITAVRGTVEGIIIQTLDPEDLRHAQMEVEGIMRGRRRLRPSEPNDFSLETAEESLSFWDDISRVLFIALPGLVSISLVVGGIVIMNIMLVSVLERTREIGVRKALGATQRDILCQVLIESATLSGLGAVLGAGIGIGATAIIRATSPLPAVVAPHWIALGVGLGVVIGIVAGVYPASRAAKLNPVDALRYE